MKAMSDDTKSLDSPRNLGNKDIVRILSDKLRYESSRIDWLVGQAHEMLDTERMQCKRLLELQDEISRLKWRLDGKG